MSNLGEQDLSFHVDNVGVPVLVKIKLFPNWMSVAPRCRTESRHPDGGGATSNDVHLTTAVHTSTSAQYAMIHPARAPGRGRSPAMCATGRHAARIVEYRTSYRDDLDPGLAALTPISMPTSAGPTHRSPPGWAAPDIDSEPCVGRPTERPDQVLDATRST